MKKSRILLLLVSSFIATGLQAYTGEINGNIGQVSPDGTEDVTTYGVSGTLYFDEVKTGQHALSRQIAPFLNENSNATLGIGKAEFAGIKGTIVHAGAELWVPDSDFYVSAKASRFSVEGEHVNGFGGELGFNPMRELLITVGFEGDSNDTDPHIHAKYVGISGANEYVVESTYTLFEGDDALAVQGSYFFTQTFGATAGITFVGGENILAIGAENFFTNQISGQVLYTTADGVDALVLSAGLRF